MARGINEEQLEAIYRVKTRVETIPMKSWKNFLKK